MSKRNSTLTAERLRQSLSYDQDTGVFRWARYTARCKVGAVAGTINDRGYRRINIDKVEYSAGRLAWLYVYGSWPTHDIDHINGVRDDNRICNLRDIPSSINQQNIRRPLKSNKSGFLGVAAKKNSFLATIQVNGKSFYLGSYRTAEEAHRAYVEAKRRLHPACTI